MAIKATFIRRLLWKLKCPGFYKAPPAFWFGFWCVFGAYWALVLIGWVQQLALITHELLFS